MSEKAQTDLQRTVEESVHSLLAASVHSSCLGRLIVDGHSSRDKRKDKDKDEEKDRSARRRVAFSPHFFPRRFFSQADLENSESGDEAAGHSSEDDVCDVRIAEGNEDESETDVSPKPPVPARAASERSHWTERSEEKGTVALTKCTVALTLSSDRLSRRAEESESPLRCVQRTRLMLLPEELDVLTVMVM